MQEHRRERTTRLRREPEGVRVQTVTLRKAATAWRELVPRGNQVGVLDGTIYQLPRTVDIGSDAGLREAGWSFSDDGARSLHPMPRHDTKLAKASEALRAACQGFVDDESSDRLAARNLAAAVQSLATQLDGRPDPATYGQLQAVREMEFAIIELQAEEARRRAEIAANEKAIEDERRHARLVAEELAKIAGLTSSDAASSSAEEQRKRHQQELAESAFGRDALALLAEAHRVAPGSWRQLAAFNGCGGQRWDPTRPAKERGHGYDYARKTLNEMMRAGLLEPSGAGKTKRGAWRITADGLAWATVVGMS